jgi:hypothetical protein
MGLRFRVVLLIAVAVSGGLLATVASAASASKTSVSLQFASHTNFKGRVSSRCRGYGLVRVGDIEDRDRAGGHHRRVRPAWRIRAQAARVQSPAHS